LHPRAGFSLIGSLCYFTDLLLYMNWTRICLQNTLCFFTSEQKSFPLIRYHDGLVLILDLHLFMHAQYAVLNMPNNHFMSDTVMAWSFFVIILTAFFAHAHYDFTWFFSFCSDTAFTTWPLPAIVYACALGFFAFIFFPLLRYHDRVELLLHKLYLQLFAHAHRCVFNFYSDTLMGLALDTYTVPTIVCACASMRFPFAQIPWWAGAGATGTGPAFVRACALQFFRINLSPLLRNRDGLELL
jgi:hypothetical protein